MQAITHDANDVAKHVLAKLDRNIARLHIQTGAQYLPSLCNETSERSAAPTEAAAMVVVAAGTEAVHHRLTKIGLSQGMGPRPCSPDIGPTAPVAKHLRDV